MKGREGGGGILSQDKLTYLDLSNTNISLFTLQQTPPHHHSNKSEISQNLQSYNVTMRWRKSLKMINISILGYQVSSPGRILTHHAKFQGRHVFFQIATKTTYIERQICLFPAFIKYQDISVSAAYLFISSSQQQICGWGGCSLLQSGREGGREMSELPF